MANDRLELRVCVVFLNYPYAAFSSRPPYGREVQVGVGRGEVSGDVNCDNRRVKLGGM